MKAKPDYRAVWRAKHPWARYVEYARRRCSEETDLRINPWWPFYGSKGIRCVLTAKDLEVIWKRDKADELKKPSLDRIDPNKGYIPSNVRFIEFKLNSRMAWDPTKRDGYAEQAPEFT